MPICFMPLALATVVVYGCQKKFLAGQPSRERVDKWVGWGREMGVPRLLLKLALASCKSWLKVFAYMHNCAKHINSVVYCIS